MKKLLLLTAIVFLPLAARAGFEIVQEMESEGQKTLLTTQYQNDMLRADMGKEMSLIIDTTTRDTTSIMHDQKMVMKVPGAMTQALGGAVAQQMAGNTKAETLKFEKTGRKEVINGFDCEEYVGSTSLGKTTIWVSSNTPLSKDFLDQMRKICEDSDMGDMSASFIFEGDGYPVRTIFEGKDGTKNVLTTLSILEKDIPASAFQAPSGYKTMDVSDSLQQLLQGMQGGQ